MGEDRSGAFLELQGSFSCLSSKAPSVAQRSIALRSEAKKEERDCHTHKVKIATQMENTLNNAGMIEIVFSLPKIDIYSIVIQLLLFITRFFTSFILLATHYFNV